MKQIIASDEECLKLLNEENPAAIDYLIRIYFPVLCHYAQKILNGDVAGAEDVTENSFIKLWQGNNKFTHFNEVKKFLYITIHNDCLNIIRSKQREHNREKEFTETYITSDNDTVNELIHAELLAEIRKQINQLPNKMREIFILSYFKKMSNQDIADHLKLSQQTVRNQKTKALALLKLLLKDKKSYLLLLLLTQQLPHITAH